MKGKFVVVDGLDGSGKGTILHGLEEWAKNSKLKVLHLKDYCREHKNFPESEDLAEFDVIRSDEPTYSFVGQAIRDEMIRSNHRNYSALSVAQAFALDREILYKRVLIPALKSGKHVFQERGIVTSVVYQPVQERLQLSELLKLPGNKLAMQNAPDLLIITQVSPEAVMERLNTKEKRDNSIFENLLFQRKVAERYSASWLRSLFEGCGTSVVYIDTNPPKTAEDAKKEAVEIWERLLELKK
jgi:dTMP kinase